MKALARCVLFAALILFGTAAWPFSDGFEANAFDPSDIKSISIDAATPIPVKDVAISPAGLLTAKRDAGPTPPVPVCKPVPAGITVHRMQWAQIFGGHAWPGSPSWQQPIGSFSLRSGSGMYKQGKPIAGQVLTSGFVMDNKTHKLDWVHAQPVDFAGYNPGQVALSVTVAVSECPGDLYAACKVTAKSSRLNYGPTAAGACKFQPGQTLYATWHYLPPNLDPKVNTCMPQNPSGGVKCDSNFGSN